MATFPGWVIGADSDPPPGSVSGAPSDLLLVDHQLFPAAGRRYLRQVMRPNDAEGVEALAQVSLEFDPDTEQLAVHSVRVWRDGAATERASDGAFSLVGHGTGPERRPGSAQLPLDDLRPGDLVDVAYTRTARHPHPDGHFDCTVPIAPQIPVARWSASIIARDGTALRWRGEPDPGDPVTHPVKDGWTLHRWSRDGVPATETEPNVPGWYPQPGSLQISDFTSWSEVVDRAREVWGDPQPPAGLREIARQILSETQNGDATARADRALAFVRDEIRPTAAGGDPGTRHPPPPEEVLRRRSGDSRDKSSLLVLLLRLLEIPAAPTLVNSAAGRGVADMLPGLGAFDHVIVCVQIGGAKVWIDPTRSGLRESVAELPPPGFGVGLPLSSKATGLSEIPPTPPDAALLVVAEHFTVRHPDKAVALQVEVTASGYEADRLRGELDALDMSGYREAREAEMRTRYPQARATGEWSRDDAPGGGLTLRGSFEIENFAIQGEGDGRTTPYGPSWIQARFPGAPDGGRVAPWALPFPCRIRHELTFDLPFSVPEGTDRREVDSPAFGFNSRVDARGRSVSATFRYWSKADHVAADEIAAFRKKVGEMAEASARSILYPSSPNVRTNRVGESGIRRGSQRPPDGGTKPLRWVAVAACAVGAALLGRLAFGMLIGDTDKPRPQVDPKATSPGTPAPKGGTAPEPLDFLANPGVANPLDAPLGDRPGTDDETDPGEATYDGLDFKGSLLETPEEDDSSRRGIEKIGDREFLDLDLTP